MDRIEPTAETARPTPPAIRTDTRCAGRNGHGAGAVVAATLACLAGMAAMVWVADHLWGSVGMGVLLALALTAAFALPELMLIVLTQVQRDEAADAGQASGTVRQPLNETGPLRGAGLQVPKGGLEPPT